MSLVATDRPAPAPATDRPDREPSRLSLLLEVLAHAGASVDPTRPWPPGASPASGTRRSAAAAGERSPAQLTVAAHLAWAAGLRRFQVGRARPRCHSAGAAGSASTNSSTSKPSRPGDGTVRGWGNNGHGQLGDGAVNIVQPTPVTALRLAGVKGVAGGWFHSLART